MLNSITTLKTGAKAPQHRRAFQGYLAEDYDGISQWVVVALSRSSVSSALRVHVAPGDQNTAGKYPAGTPVLLYADRGHLEVVLGLGSPQLSTGPCGNDQISIWHDDFDRTTASGWDTATDGHVWTVIQAGTGISVSGNTGHASSNGVGGNEARLDIKLADGCLAAGQLDFLMEFIWSAEFPANTGMGANQADFDLLLLLNNNSDSAYFQLELFRNALGPLTAGVYDNVGLLNWTAFGGQDYDDLGKPAGLAAGVTWSVRIQVDKSGDRIRYRLWDTSGPEPSTWNHQANLSGWPASGTDDWVFELALTPHDTAAGKITLDVNYILLQP